MGAGYIYTSYRKLNFIKITIDDRTDEDCTTLDKEQRYRRHLLLLIPRENDLDDYQSWRLTDHETNELVIQLLTFFHMENTCTLYRGVRDTPHTAQKRFPFFGKFNYSNCGFSVGTRSLFC